MGTSSSIPPDPASRRGAVAATKIMFVEDDAVVARIYTQKLTQAGFEVAYAEDGVEALRQLPGFKPDLVILDLVMPRMTGPDVLRFMRQNAELKSTKVIVFSSSFLANQAGQVAALGVELALVKSAVTPAILVDEIHKVLGTTPPADDAPAPPQPRSPEIAGKPVPTRGPAQPAPKQESDTVFLTRIDREFRERTPVALNEIRGLCQDFLEAADPAAQAGQLAALNKKLGFLTQISAMAGYQWTAELASALDALVIELANQPALINDSSRQTLASTAAQLARSLDGPAPATSRDRRQAAILVVDGDAASNRAMVDALGWAQIPATGVADPSEALNMLQQTLCDVVLLDVNLPGIDVSALREQMRGLPANNRTPVIYITSETDFPAQVESVLSAGDDLIAKPFSPAELCVKVIARLQKAAE